MTRKNNSLRPVQKRQPKKTRAHSFDNTTSLRYPTTTTATSTKKSSTTDTKRENLRENMGIINVDKEDTQKCPEHNNEQADLTENNKFKRTYTIREQKGYFVSSPKSTQEVASTSQASCSEKTANEEEYTAFRTELLRDIPDYVQSTNLDMDQNKIYVGVKRGNISEASTFLHGISKQLFEQGIICIQEVGNLQLAVIKKPEFTANHENNRDSECYKTYPGDTLPYIGPGKRIIINADDTESKFATLGAIGQDSAGNLYIITAQHLFGTMIYEKQVKTYCQLNTTQMTSYELGNKSYGYFGSNKLKGPFHDIAIIPLLKNEQLFHQISPCFKNNQNEDLNIEVYRDDLSKVKGHVQQIGATSGTVKGPIIVPRFDFYHDKKWLGSDCFKVAAEDGPFGELGDSGAFITNDLSSASSSLAIAYGMFFLLEDVGTYISPSKGKEKEYKSVAWCVRLDSGLEILKKKFDITVDLISPENWKNFNSKFHEKKCIAPADNKKMGSKEKRRSEHTLQRYNTLPGKQKRRKDAARYKTWPTKRLAKQMTMMQLNADYMDIRL